MLRVKAYLDYIDPGSFVMDRRLRALAGSLEFEAERLPWEVRRPPEPMLDALSAGWQEYWAAMAAEANADGFELSAPALVPWTRKAHELARLAGEKGCFDKVHDDLMSAVHIEGRDVGRVDVLVELGQAAGLDRTETKAVLDVDRHAEALDEVRRVATAEGVRGVPTIVVEGECLEGVHSLEAIRDFLDRVTESRASDTQDD